MMIVIVIIMLIMIIVIMIMMLITVIMIIILIMIIVIIGTCYPVYWGITVLTFLSIFFSNGEKNNQQANILLFREVQ
jgi:hypothetical protein